MNSLEKVIKWRIYEYSSIMVSSDETLEEKHDWIQCAFPGDWASAYDATAPVLTKEEFEFLANSPGNREFMQEITNRYLQFLDHNQEWVEDPRNHNRKRITRVIHSLRLQGLDDIAKGVAVYACTRCQAEGITDSIIRWHQATIIGEKLK